MFNEVIEKEIFSIVMSGRPAFLYLHSMSTSCYVLRWEEAPEGVRQVLHIGNRFQDIVCRISLNCTGNDVFLRSIHQAKEEDIVPMFTHPLGTYGSAGPVFDNTQQEPIPGRGNTKFGTARVMLLELTIPHHPEWMISTFAYLEDILFRNGVASYLPTPNRTCWSSDDFANDQR